MLGGTGGEEEEEILRKRVWLLSAVATAEDAITKDASCRSVFEDDLSVEVLVTETGSETLLSSSSFCSTCPLSCCSDTDDNWSLDSDVLSGTVSDEEISLIISADVTV